MKTEPLNFGLISISSREMAGDQTVTLTSLTDRSLVGSINGVPQAIASIVLRPNGSSKLMRCTQDTPGLLPVAWRREIEDPLNLVYFSAASIWEIAIKPGLGKVNFQHSAEAIAHGAVDSTYASAPHKYGR